MYNQFSSKNNLFKWKKESDPPSPLCNDKPQTLEHVLSSCKTALGNGRYTWRHDKVLEELVKFIELYEIRINYFNPEICFSELAEYTLALSKQLSIELYPVKTFLDKVDIGEVSADLPGWHNNYSKTISSKGLRPDTVLLSRAGLKIIMVELSIPYESRVDLSYEHKTSKYEDLEKKLEKGRVPRYRERCR